LVVPLKYSDIPEKMGVIRRLSRETGEDVCFVLCPGFTVGELRRLSLTYGLQERLLAAIRACKALLQQDF